MELLRKQYPNNNSYSTHLIRLINETKPSGNIKLLTKYRAELYKIKKIQESKLENQQATQKELDNYLSLDTMKQIWNDLDDNVNKLILGLYIFIPPLRSDWVNATVKGKYFVFDKFLKRKPGNEQGSLKKPIPVELLTLVKFFDKIPKNSNTLSQRLLSISKRVFNRKIGINMFRKIWIHDVGSNTSIKNRKILAKEMNHSVGISRLYYEKLDLGS